LSCPESTTQGKVIDQFTGVKTCSEAKDDSPLQLMLFRIPGSPASEAGLAKKVQNALKIQTPLTRAISLKLPPNLAWLIFFQTAGNYVQGQ
jgi:hypothetical protein